MDIMMAMRLKRTRLSLFLLLPALAAAWAA